MKTTAEPQNDRIVAHGGARRKLLIVVLSGLVLAGAGGVASSARAAGPAGDDVADGPQMRRMERILDRVGATPAQREKIHAIWSGLRPQLRAERAQHKTLRQQLVAALTAPNINAGEVERLRKLSIASADKLSALFTQGMIASSQVLTPEQRKLAQEELAKGGHHRWGRHAR
jgi:Spy/CpxP family protein refolding chaperone